MIALNYRIVDEIDKLKLMDSSWFDKSHEHISGFIEFCFGDQKEGCYYHENPLRDGETGGELLDWWFNYLLDTVNFLIITKYVAFNEPENVNRWLEFKLIDNTVKINIAKAKPGKKGINFTIDANVEFDYIEIKEFSVQYDEFKKEVLNKINRFLCELKNLNSNLLQTKMAFELLSKMTI